MSVETRAHTHVITPISIHKRDGRVVDFDLGKVIDALTKAFAATDQDNPKQHAHQVSFGVLAELQRRELSTPSVEDVQNIVEDTLMRYGYPHTAKAYILYRNERTRAREAQNRLMQSFDKITFGAEISDAQRENANVDANSAMGTMLQYGSESAKQFNILRVLNPDHAAAHVAGDIHIHDLDFLTLTMTCCQISLRDLFKGGFSTGHGVIREPKSITSYASLACIAIQSNQNDQHGGQAVPNFDYDMADGVRMTFNSIYRSNLAKAFRLFGAEEAAEKLGDVELRARLSATDDVLKQEAEELSEALGIELKTVVKVQKFALKEAETETRRATYQAMEAFLHNLNTMNSRAGAQTPFSSINFGTDVSAEGRLVMQQLLLATEAGLGHGETAIFPIQIFRVAEGVNLNPGDPNYDLFQLACRVSAKRLFPNFSFLDSPFNRQYYKLGHPETEVAYMGCRTRVMGNVADPTREITHGRGNLSFTSINLPRLAIEARGSISEFFKSLDSEIDLVIDQLLERLAIQSKRRVCNFPFLMGQGVWIDSEKLDWKDQVAEVLKHGTLAIGFIGLAETLIALIGEHHGQSEKAQALGLEIVRQMRRRTDEAAEKYRLNFSLIATPAEGLSGRFVRMDKERYGDIEGVTDKDYYTNSFHIPVAFNISAFDKIRLEAPYHELTNGGHISYIELDGDPTKNLSAFEAVVRQMYASGIGYGAINHPVDRDPVCEFTGCIDDECPNCGRHETPDKPFDRIRRITGYLVGTLDRFNDAKRAEEADRVKHGSRSPLI
ncbi:anaerobic ribonucleoside triphosphate reductase [Propionimicrobium lymphophilum]|uniref:anaerobic ribonucleoside triphosphate reductase n=1 Tax=Propionimicrobium TaxID=203133 RepID=UPI0003D79959|nr:MULTISPECIES: anaerobic ribonucleoside triphosphate reductase [Propionimicrobium]ETJ97205.1 anaerobic ribonucleoside-triphosphate reductase [Propionimicrobium sp. BV2F7]MDK7709453.1 anaerobic ribonucleoside triphosphate reductase [Propionimicrobium lymphophilum]MDK7733439.1 anaerobic ribonucleoside triphosphate reductase [Propionimicrobium lymphophilum]